MSHTVLVCDDAIFMRTMISDILTQAGFEVVGEAETGVQAVEKFRQTIAIDPRHAKGHNNLGDALVKVSRLDEAQTEFEEAIRIQPNYHKARINLALLHRQRGQYKEALEQCRIVLQADPANTAAHDLFNAIQTEIEK